MPTQTIERARPTTRHGPESLQQATPPPPEFDYLVRPDWENKQLEKLALTWETRKLDFFTDLFAATINALEEDKEPPLTPVLAGSLVKITEHVRDCWDSRRLRQHNAIDQREAPKNLTTALGALRSIQSFGSAETFDFFTTEPWQRAFAWAGEMEVESQPLSFETILFEAQRLDTFSNVFLNMRTALQDKGNEYHTPGAKAALHETTNTLITILELAANALGSHLDDSPEPLPSDTQTTIAELMAKLRASYASFAP